jgi:hypothetical protein
MLQKEIYGTTEPAKTTFPHKPTQMNSLTLKEMMCICWDRHYCAHFTSAIQLIFNRQSSPVKGTVEFPVLKQLHK